MRSRSPETPSLLWPALLLAATAAVVLLPGSNLMPLVDRDEPRFSQATSEMMDRGEWVIPYFNGEYRFDKPILIYWMMRASSAVFGVNEFGARAPSMLCTLFLAWLVLRMGIRWFSVQTGFFAAFGLLTCVQVLMHGRSAAADMPMVLMMTLAQYAAFELVFDEGPRYPWRRFWTLYLALGLGFLAKGPVAIAVPLLTFLLYRLALWRRPLSWSRLRLGIGLPIALAVVGAWGIPALLKTHGEFWTVGITTHVWKRGLATFQGHGSFFLYYVAVALISLFPWIAFAGDGIGALRRNWNEKNAFLLSWIVVTYVLFSFYTTKLAHYVLPAFPALFLVIGQASEAGFGLSRAARAWFWLALSLPTALAAVLCGGALVKALMTPDTLAPWAAVAGSGLLLALAGLAFFWRRGTARYSAIPLAAAALCSLLLGSAMRELTPAVQLLPTFSGMPDDAVYAFYRYREPSLVFYSNRQWQSPGSAEELKTFLQTNRHCLAVALDQETRLSDYRLGRGGSRAPPKDYSAELAVLDSVPCEVLTVSGINIARGSSVRLKVFYRR
ncbi:MAG: glycosyltransferase family 39 protein [Verrucomicrobiota bacterium]